MRQKVQMNLFGGCLAQKVNEEGLTDQYLIYCTESTMEEFGEHFLESLLEGLKAKVKWAGLNGVYFYLNNYFYLGMNNSFLEKKNGSLYLFLSLDI
jgi:hypothetical protein